MNSCFYECQVLHARFSPRPHRFLYRIFLFAIDLDELEALHRRLPFFSVGRRNLYSFRDGDYLPTGEPLHHGSAGGSPASAKVAGGPPALPLKQRVVAHLAEHGVDLTGGRVMLVTLPRIFGYLFNPVSFYFCYDRTGTCVASLAEVTNTFKEMKPYFLGPACRGPGAEDRERKTENDGPTVALNPSADLHPQSSEFRPPSSVLRPPSSEPAPGAVFRLRTPKHFYVSPFSDVDVAFDFTLRTPGDKLSIQIDDYVGAERVLTSTLAGPRRELTDARLAWFTLKYPLLTLRIISLIHWHAFLLWLKRMPWFAKAARSADQRDLYRPHTSIAHSPALASAQSTDAA